MVKAGGNTVIVAGGGGASGGSGGSKGGSSGDGGGDSKPKGGGSKDKLKINDEMFNTALMALIGVGAVAYVYYSRPDLVNEFIGTFTGNKHPSVPAVPAQPPGTVQNDMMPQDNLPYDQQGGMMLPQQQMNYPTFPQQNQGSGYEQFQYPPQSPNIQQYQPYQPSQYGGGGDFSTSFNPTFGQNSNMPTQSFAARRLTKLDYDSQDGMITRV